MAFACGTLLAWSSLPFESPMPRQSIGAFVAVASGVLACLAGQSHYHRRIPYWNELQHLVLVSIAALLCSGFLVFLLHEQTSRLLLVSTWVLLPALIMLLRRTTRRALASVGLWQIRTVIVGTGDTAQQTITALMSEPGLGYDIVGVVKLSDLRLTGSAPCWRTLLKQHHAHLVVLALDRDNAPRQATIESLVRQRVLFAMVPPTGGLPVLGFEQTHFFSHDTVMFTYRNNLAQPVSRMTKVVLDLLVAVCALVVLAPLLILIAVTIKLDGGPILFLHPRLGAGGRIFQCLKFRSMVPDSAAVLQRVLSTDPAAAAEWAATQKLRDDPRITRVGAILRKTSLDELPQLFNVLRLEMSLVGPRPIVSSEVARYGEDIAYYYETRPGVTGLWQVSGRNGTTYAQRVQLDTWYVKNWTIWHDVAIMAKTIPAVLKRKGAY